MCADDPCAIYKHCYRHSLNLACSDAVKGCSLMKNVLEITHEITKLVKKSLVCDAIFKRLKGEANSGTPRICLLSPTRWMVQAEVFQSILDNYTVLFELQSELSDRVKDTEMKA